MNNFFGKVIIVTGGFKGNGLSIVKAFLNFGATVYSLDSKHSKKKEINDNLVKIKINLENLKEIKQTINYIGKQKKKIDILINNAGVSLINNKKNFLVNWNKTLSINLTSPYLLSVYSLPFLKKSEFPNIINISSLASKIAMSNNPSYNVSKGGISALSYSLAMDFSKFGIRVNSICPGYIKTDMTKNSFSKKKEYRKRIGRMMIKKYGTPEDVSSAVIFLCSENAKYINAADLVIDGGFIKKGI